MANSRRSRRPLRNSQPEPSDDPDIGGVVVALIVVIVGGIGALVVSAFLS